MTLAPTKFLRLRKPVNASANATAATVNAVIECLLSMFPW